MPRSVLQGHFSLLSHGVITSSDLVILLYFFCPCTALPPYCTHRGFGIVVFSISFGSHFCRFLQSTFFHGFTEVPLFPFRTVSLERSWLLLFVDKICAVIRRGSAEAAALEFCAHFRSHRIFRLVYRVMTVLQYCAIFANTPDHRWLYTSSVLASRFFNCSLELSIFTRNASISLNSVLRHTTWLRFR